MFQRLAAVAVTALMLGAQSQVSVSNFPNKIEPAMVVIAKNGAGAPTHICYANPGGPWNNNSIPATFSWTRAANTLTSIAVATNTATATTSTAHGLVIGNPAVVSGATVDAQLNGTYTILTVPSATTFTFTTVAVSDATYTEATLALATTAPRTTVNIWSIQNIRYDGSGYYDGSAWAGGAAGVATNICANYATLTYR